MNYFTKQGRATKKIWHINPDEEYVWSMRYYKSIGKSLEDTDSSNDSSDDENLPRSTICKKDDELERNQIKVLASLLPLEVLRYLDHYPPREIECTLLYAKIKVITNIMNNKPVEKNSNLRPSKQFNSLFATLVQEILLNGGDVLKCTSTKIIAIWKSTNIQNFTDSVHIAIDCALVLTKQYGNSLLSEEEVLQVGFGITAGTLYIGIIGDNEHSKFVVGGPIYEEIKQARTEAATLNVIISPTGMNYASSFEYHLAQIGETTFFEVVGLSSTWRQIRKSESREVSSLSRIHGTDSSSNLTASDTTDLSIEKSIINYLMEDSAASIDAVLRFLPEVMRDEYIANVPLNNFAELREVAVATLSITTRSVKWSRILEFTNLLYKTVQRYCTKYKGYVTDVTLMKQSIVFVIAFGLRGVTHMQQYRSALNCSLDIFSIYKDDTKFTDITIGISSGTAYYGPIGHILRRDFILIGPPIQNSKMLSTSFLNTILCDEHTFLYSRMESSCFKLCNERLCIIYNQGGSVYEFVSYEDYTKKKMRNDDQPRIGRKGEIDIYLKHLESFCSSYDEIKSNESILSTTQVVKNVVYIKGDPKEGKSRLLYEMVKETPRHIIVHTVFLDPRLAKDPFYLIRKIFYTHLEDMFETSRNERENHLLKILHDIPSLDLLCSINELFDVKFPEAEIFEKFPNEEKYSIVLTILKYLCFKIFLKPWVLAVNSGDHLDELTWTLLGDLVNTGTFFLIITKSKNNPIIVRTSNIPFLKERNVEKINLRPLDRIYVSGLIAQHIGVCAIPCDLENLFQSQTTQNIGYLQNTLQSLSDKGFFKFGAMLFEKLDNADLLLPPLHLMKNIPDKKDNEHNGALFFTGFDDKCKEKAWHFFVNSFQNENFMKERKKLYKDIFKSENLRVCLLEKDLHNNKIPEDISLKIYNTQKFEKLSYVEQIILKCCSILQGAFPRVLLEKIVPLTYYNALAPAIKVFFDMRILCCNQGDFTETIQFSVIRKKITSVDDSKIQCKCRGLFYTDRDFSLPDYAYCGLLRFRSTSFKEHIYDLVDEAQKIDVNSKIVLYLREETKRCLSCGGDSFMWDKFKRLDDYQERRKLGSSIRRSDFDYDVNFPSTTMKDLLYEHTSFATSRSFASDPYTFSERDTITADFNSLMSSHSHATATYDFSVRKVFGPHALTKMHTNLLLVRTFSNCEFFYCECKQILGFFYREMMVYCRGAGELVDCLQNMQKYAYMCIDRNDISEAHIVLRKAFKVVEEIYKMNKPPPPWKRALMEAKLLTISAQAYKKNGDDEEAMQILNVALKKFGVKFPRTRIGIFLSRANAKLKKILTFVVFPEMLTKNLGYSICEYYVDMAEALNVMVEYLVEDGKWQKAELVASWSLYKALNAQTSFDRICDCFTNMINIALHNHNGYMCMALEVHALRFCYRITTRVEFWELLSVSKMYIAIFKSKLVRGDAEYTIHMGYMIIRIAVSLNERLDVLEISAFLITVLTSKLLLQEAISLLLELQYTPPDIENISIEKILYFTEALVMQLDIGYCIVPFEECHQYFKKMPDEHNYSNLDAMDRLHVLTWLWCIRNEQWESIVQFENSVTYWMDHISIIETIHTPVLIYILEGKLLLYVHKLNKGNMADAAELEKTIIFLIKIINKITSFALMFKPKFFILVAYFYHVMDDTKKAEKWLTKCENTSNKLQLILIPEMTKHMRKAWNNKLSTKALTLWRNKCDIINYDFYNEFDMNVEDLALYTYPSPLYV